MWTQPLSSILTIFILWTAFFKEENKVFCFSNLDSIKNESRISGESATGSNDIRTTYGLVKDVCVNLISGEWSMSLNSSNICSVCSAFISFPQVISQVILLPSLSRTINRSSCLFMISTLARVGMPNGWSLFSCNYGMISMTERSFM